MILVHRSLRSVMGTGHMPCLQRSGNARIIPCPPDVAITKSSNFTERRTSELCREVAHQKIGKFARFGVKTTI
jgi:hypothetical protein